MYRQSEKNLLNSNTSSTCPDNMVNLPTNGWDLLASLGHPSKFQRVSHLDSVTARHSSCGSQPNFAALNRGPHLYSAGRPSRWSLAHILVSFSGAAAWNSLSADYRTQWTAEGSVFGAVTLRFLLNDKFTWKACLVSCSDEFEGQGQRSKVKVTGTKTAFLRPACDLCLVKHL